MIGAKSHAGPKLLGTMLNFMHKHQKFLPRVPPCNLHFLQQFCMGGAFLRGGGIFGTHNFNAAAPSTHPQPLRLCMPVVQHVYNRHAKFQVKRLRSGHLLPDLVIILQQLVQPLVQHHGIGLHMWQVHQ